MPRPHFIKRRDSRSTGGGITGGKVTLPPDLIEKAGKRLGLAALVYAVAYLLAYGTSRVTQNFADIWGGGFPNLPDFCAAGFIALAIGMFFLARSQLVAGTQLLDLGLVFEVVGAIGIDFFFVWGLWPTGLQMTGISWVCVWIVFFPLIVPSTPGKTLVVSLLAASATPVLYRIGVAQGGDPLGATALSYIIPNYICAGIAVVGARVVYRLGSDISRARRMGSYQLVEKLGEGGMGEVWKAEHRMLARPAAIKLVRGSPAGTGPGRTTGSDVHRFEREVQATAQLRSPHTVEVYDYGLTEDRTFYYVMELLDGLSLEELVTQYGPTPAARVVHIIRQACHSLAEAHARGLVHRDIKPANIFLCRYGLEYDFVKVLDFGLVKPAGVDAPGDVKLTDVGSFAGTPAYVSPEAAMGERDKVDMGSDIYSLGCVAYWLLTGRTVFAGSTPMQVLFQHVHQEPAPPSSCTELKIPKELDALVLECLRKEKEARPRSVEQLGARLEALPFDDPWTVERSRQWWDRHRPARHEAQVAWSVADTAAGAAQPIAKL